jgi:8-oxo-dGTP pyrophosphatase MutT (NUDIX family)
VSTSSPAPPRPAATVVVCRQETDGLEVYLVKRHGRSGFMAGAHVYPGGRVDDADGALGDALAPEVRSSASALLDGMDGREAVAFCVAALRETAEECGLLLARDREGVVPDAAAAAAVARELRDGHPFAAVLESKGLVPDVGALRALAWWVTPAAEPKRYDTRFFLAAAPPQQRADVDAHETTEGEWLAPAAALAAYAEGRIVLSPPTLCTLEDLEGFTTLDEAAAAVPRPVPRIEPLLLSGDSGLILALPGDPLHPEPHRAAARRSRVIMSDGGRFTSLVVDA